MYRTFRYAGWKSQSAYADFASLATVLTAELSVGVASALATAYHQVQADAAR
jgi:hypothetical protein